MLMLLQLELSQIQAGALFGGLLGGILGLLPLVLGIIFKRAKIGAVAFVASIIGSAILGLILSIPIVAVSLYLIFRKEPARDAQAEQQLP